MKSRREGVKFFVGCIAQADSIWPRLDGSVRNLLISLYGPIESIWSPTKSWVAPSSYANEMGCDLSTIIIIFQNSCVVNDMTRRKEQAIEVEDWLTFYGRRKYNLNPGYVGSSGIFLASHKDGAYRLALGNGIWLEKQLDWRDGTFVSLPNTFSEYADVNRIAGFNKLRFLF